MRAPLLLLSATEFETAPLTTGFKPASDHGSPLPAGWRAQVGELAGVACLAVATGVGKVNAALLTGLAVTAYRPGAVLLVGIGGAYPNAGLAIGQAALALSDTHLDSGVGHGAGWSGLESIGFPLLPAAAHRAEPVYNTVNLAARTNELAQRLRVPAVRFGTAEAVTADDVTARLLHSRHGVAIESMEGAAVAQVAAALNVPLYQVRGVSNLVGDRNKSNWRVQEAVQAACATARGLAPLLMEAR